MSANNQLIIMKTKSKVNPYEIWEHHCVDNDFRFGENTRLAFATSLKKAIIFANKYCQEEIVEYGYHIDDICLV